MKYKKYIKKIQENFHNDRYSEVISLIDEYLTIPGVGMYDMLAYYYGVSLMSLGNTELASKYLDMSCHLLSNTTIMKIRVANSYRHYQMYQKAKEILEEVIADENYQDFIGYYTLAKVEFYAGNYERAADLFTKASKYVENDFAVAKIAMFIDKINTYLKSGTKKIDFEAFKGQGENLQVGHIIYVKIPKENVIASSSDSYYFKRTYLITEINNNEIHAISLSNYPVPNSFHLPRTLCCSLDDKYALYSFRTFNINQVESVVGKINLHDVQKILYYFYHYYQDFYNETKTNNQVYSLESSKKSASSCNVLVVYNPDIAKEEYYYVINIHENEYEVVKLNIQNGAFIPTDDFTLLGIDSYILDVIPLHPRIIAHISDYLGTSNHR